MKINWVNKKDINWDRVKHYMDFSIKENQFSNDGPLQKMLSDRLRSILKISSSKVIIPTCSGTAALHALVSGINSKLGVETRWATQDYTFPVSAQGVLRNSVIVDIDYNDISPDLNSLEHIKDNINGVIVTNMFGFASDVEKFIKWSVDNDKFLIFDSATAPYTFYNFLNVNNFGVGSIISLHHTKPLGFGEGGVIIVDREYEADVRKSINFGYTKSVKKWSVHGSNWRMSDISAAFILQHLDNFYAIDHIHKELAKYFENKLKETRFEFIKQYDNSLISCLPIKSFEGEIDIKDVEYKKYYEPLIGYANSNKLYNEIVCFPLNTDMTNEDLDYIIKYLKTK